MSVRHALVLAAALAVVPRSAWAHAPVPGVGAFWNGVLHPVLVPLHLLALVGAGLVLGQNAPRASRIALPLFGAALAVAIFAAGPVGTQGPALLAVSVAAGLLAALGRAGVLPTAALSTAAAVAIGLDSGSAETVSASAWLTTIGSLTGCLVVVVLAGGLAAASAASWQRIAVRVAGSWIAAASLIALTLAVAQAQRWP